MMIKLNLGDGWMPIESAPRDGTQIIVMHDDVGSFPMRWNAKGFNMLASTSVGIWEGPGGEFTWCDEGDLGPSHWRPCDAIH